jgi:hypothetical protein
VVGRLSLVGPKAPENIFEALELLFGTFKP